MNREEILAMSRQENKNMDLVDKAVEDRSKTIAGMVMVSMCLLYHLVEMVILNRKNYGFFSIAAVYPASLFIMKGIKFKDRGKLITGIIWLALAVLFAVEHFYFLVTNTTLF